MSDAPKVYANHQAMSEALGGAPSRFWFCTRCFACFEVDQPRCLACGDRVVVPAMRLKDPSRRPGRPKGSKNKPKKKALGKNKG